MSERRLFWPVLLALLAVPVAVQEIRLARTTVYIVDRIEGGYAVLEDPDRSLHPVPTDSLPPVVEGAVLVVLGSRWDQSRVDTTATTRRFEAARRAHNRLRSRLCPSGLTPCRATP